MYTGSDNDVAPAADPTDQRISVSVEKITYGDDKGKYRVYFSASRSETYADMAAALKGMAQYGAPSVVSIGKSISFYVIDKARKPKGKS